jgi:cation diffusion facilitator family transporter
MLEQSQKRKNGAYLSLTGAIAVLLLKFGAFFLTGSLAFLSDAAESIVNVVAALVVLFSLRVAARPADYEHPYGHAKAEYLSSALEGGMILVAAGMIMLSSIPRLLNPEPLTNILLGLAVAITALLVNGLLVIALRREAKLNDSAALAANARHLLTDVWTSLGVIVVVVLVILSNWYILDPVIAILVAFNIIREGRNLLNQSISQLLDERLPDAEERIILNVLDAHGEVLGYHRLRTRRAGFGRFAEVDIFVSPTTRVKEAHDLVVELEDAIHQQLPNLVTTIHIEPYEAGKRDSATVPKNEYLETP